MTIASAPLAAVRSLPPNAAIQPHGDSGTQFARQLGGLVTELTAPEKPEAETAPAQPAASTPDSTAPEDATQTQINSLQPKLLVLLSLGGVRIPAGRVDARVDAKPGPRKLPGADKGADPARKSADSNNIDIAPAAAVPLVPPASDLITTAEAPAIEDAPAIAVKPAHPEPVEAPEPAAPQVTAAAGKPAEHPREMAFATRIEPVQSTGHSALPAEMASTAAVASATKKVEIDANALPIAAPLTAERSPSSPSPAPAAASRPVEAPAPVADSQPKSLAPIKEISLQVTQPGNEPIDVRVMQHGGEVHVSVHSGDATLATGLRQGLSELQSKLEENGYRSEMWRPGVATAPVAQSSSAQESTNHSRGGDAQPRHGGSQQEGGRRNQDQSNQPRWVEELESSLTGGEKSSGGFYGFGS